MKINISNQKNNIEDLELTKNIVRNSELYFIIVKTKLSDKIIENLYKMDYKIDNSIRKSIIDICMNCSNAILEFDNPDTYEVFKLYISHILYHAFGLSMHVCDLLCDEFIFEINNIKWAKGVE